MRFLWVVLILFTACVQENHHSKNKLQTSDTTTTENDTVKNPQPNSSVKKTEAKKTGSSNSVNKNKYNSSCDAELWNHVYNPERLKVMNDCVTITGTVLSVRHEADGDDHIQLKPDVAFLYMLNDKNYSGQAGCLVVEIICINKVTQADASNACVNYTTYINEPHAGDKVSVTGSYVLDIHHGWNEIHPVSELTITGKSSLENYDNNPVVGYTRSGQKIYLGPKGGRYHYSAAGNKVYEKKK